MIIKVLFLSQIPLTTAVVIREAISLTREVNPFRMTKFISHKVQVPLQNIALIFKFPLPLLRVRLSIIWSFYEEQHHGLLWWFLLARCSYWYRFPKSRYWILWSQKNYFIEKPHRECFITDDGLIMAFSITNALFSVSSVRQHMNNICHIPIIILDFFEEFDPLGGN